jgi:hypothetical protein
MKEWDLRRVEGGLVKQWQPAKVSEKQLKR